MTFRLSVRADRELASIFAESAERFGLPQAERYTEGLRHTFEFLAEFPEAARLREEMPRPARAYPYKAHLIVYDVEESGIVIQRLPHARSDWISEPD